MQTRLLMTSSAALMGALGVAASFMPQEILAHTGSRADWLPVLVVQIAGALYLGFAILNWLARGNMMGGIYSRPAALGNFLHFGVVTIALLKVMTAGHGGAMILLGMAAYAVFALWFGIVVFGADPTAAS